MRALRSLSIGAVALVVFLSPIITSMSYADVGERAASQNRAVQSPNDFQTTVKTVIDNQGESLETTNTRSLSNTLSALGTMMVSTDNPENARVFGTSAIQSMGNAVASLISNPPASAQVWLADMMQNSPFVPQAYAQGIGFKSLSPILPIWKAFRDLSYVFFVVAFMVVGFLIMFRQKMGGQAAVTLTSALPNLIITLLMITFSYAIAGLVIDIMYLVIYLIIGVLKNTNPPLLPAVLDRAGIWGDKISLEDIALSNNIFSNGLQLVFGGNVNSPTANAAKAVGAIVAGFFTSADSDGSVTKAIGGIIGGGVNVLAYLIFAVAIFFAVTKTFFQLLMSYVMFLLSVIFSPFTLMVGAFTGKTDYENWFKNLLASLAPFPVVITMIFLAMILAGQGTSAGWRGGSGGVGFQAPQIGLITDSGAIAAVQGLLAIGILMLIPEAVKYSKEWLNAKSPFEKYMGDINANLKRGWEGGELVPGLGLKMGGAKQLIPGLAQAGVGAGVGGAVGSVGGGLLGAKIAKDQGAGTGGQLLAAFGGAAVGGAGGAVAGAAGPALVPKIQTVISKGGEFVETAEKVSTIYDKVITEPSRIRRGASDIKKASSATNASAASVAPENPSTTT